MEFIEIPEKVKGTNLENHFIRQALEKKRMELNLPHCLVSEIYASKRGYGHARYEILGGHGEWKNTRDAQKVYFYFRPDGTFAFLGNEIRYTENGVPVETICISVKRLGGYNGPPSRPSLGEVIEEKTGLKYKPKN